MDTHAQRNVVTAQLEMMLYKDLVEVQFASADGGDGLSRSEIGRASLPGLRRSDMTSSTNIFEEGNQ